MQFLGLTIYQGKYQDFFKLIKNPTRKTLVFTPNPEILLRASKDEEFRVLLSQADYLTPDANGLYVGAIMQEGKSFLSAWFAVLFSRKNLQMQYGELISWSNLTKDLFDIAQKECKKILIIDSYRITNPENGFEIRKKQIQEKLPELFREQFPSLTVQILFNGEEYPEQIAHSIIQENISYVFSCIGMKSQEQILVDIWRYLPDSQRVVGLGVGSSIDYLLGLQKRAPAVMQKFWLEWLYRLILEPQKRWKRIWDALIEFPKMVRKNRGILLK